MSTRRGLPLLAVLGLLAAGCAGSTGSESVDHAHGAVMAPALVLGVPDRVIAGPQGREGQFVVECAYSHAAHDDPILYPGVPNASHLHVFFGNTGTDASSTVASLDAGETTCQQRLDRAAYWVPALFRDGAMVEPVRSLAYYRAGIDVDAELVEPYPHGLMMIAGDAGATAEQPIEIVAWTCGTGIEHRSSPPTCPEGTNLRLVVTFPDCWNGSDLGSVDPRAHVAYSSAGQCPSSHPVPIPQLQFSVEYDHTGPTGGLELASGGLLSGHADFVNTWDPAKLAAEVSLCIHRELVCNVTSDR